MKIEKTKITPQLYQSIKEIASTLPPVIRTRSNGDPIFTVVTVRGDKLTKEDLKPGTPLNPNAMYKLNKYVYENHEQNIIEGIKKHGQTFLIDYQEAIKAQYNAFVKDTKKQQTATERIKNVLNKIIPWKKTSS